ncbi:MAG: SUF system NifU family Fe-S cluster assembly protein, partial [Candidatus Marinimicrobia bacterium]|nr:SUF system NifU family Fe-S cluster assembly protein [Candidatus Neomarinimicrobiota bacterium]
NGKTDVEDIGKLAVLSGVHKFPARVKCAILPWHTMKNALERSTQTTITE